MWLGPPLVRMGAIVNKARRWPRNKAARNIKTLPDTTHCTHTQRQWLHVTVTTIPSSNSTKPQSSRFYVYLVPLKWGGGGAGAGFMTIYQRRKGREAEKRCKEWWKMHWLWLWWRSVTWKIDSFFMTQDIGKTVHGHVAERWATILKLVVMFL